MKIKILQASFSAMSALEGIVVLFLLMDTDLGCDYVGFYQTKIVPVQIATAITFQITSGILTDLSQKYAHRVAQATCFLSAVLDPIMFFLTTTNRYLVLVFFVMRFGLIVQVGNSCGKLLKLRLDKLNVREENQVHAFNNVTISGDFFSRITTVFCGYAMVSLLVREAGLGFEDVKLFFFTLVFFWDCATCLACIFITSDYFEPEEEVKQLIEFNVGEDEQLNEMSEEGGFAYFKQSAIAFFHHPMLVTMTAHLLLNLLIAGFIAIVLRFQITSGGDDIVTPVLRNNFCAGQFINILDLQAISEVIRMFGAMLYQGYLIRVRPYHFFARIWMVWGAASIGLLSINYFSLPPLAGSLVLALLNVISYLTTTYDNCIIGAVVPPQIVGFTFAVQGTTMQILGIIPVLISLAPIPTWVIITGLNAYTFGVMLFTIYIVRSRKEDLIKLDDPKQERNDGSKMLTALFGYE